jgi:hypothetical protein
MIGISTEGKKRIFIAVIFLIIGLIIGSMIGMEVGAYYTIKSIVEIGVKFGFADINEDMIKQAIYVYDHGYKSMGNLSV